MLDEDIELGYEVKDRVTGFHGIVTTVGTHISGCTRFGVTYARDESTDKSPTEEFFTGAQLEVINDETDFTGDVAGNYDDEGFDLGERVRDEVTGFEGIIGVINYKLWDCANVNIQGIDPTKTTEETDNTWCDIVRLESVDGEEFVDEYTDIQESDETTDAGPGPVRRDRQHSRRE